LELPRSYGRTGSGVSFFIDFTFTIYRAEFLSLVIMMSHILKNCISLLLIISCFCLSGCSNSQGSNADESSTYMDSLVLDAINASREQSFEIAFVKLNNVIEEAKDRDDIRSQIRAILNIGNLYTYHNSDEEGLNFLLQSLDLAQKHDQEELLKSIYNNIGIIYSSNDRLDLAEEYMSKALALNRQLKDTNKIAINLINLGNVQENSGDFEKANEYFMEALEIFKANGDSVNISVVLNNIGNIYYNEGKYTEARDYYKQAINFIQGQPMRFYLAFYTLNYGKTLYQFQEYDAALDHLHNALDSFLAVKNTDNIILCYNWLAKTNENINNDEIANQFYKESIAWKDTLLNEKQVQWVSEMEMKYEFGKKEKEIELLQLKAKQEKIIWAGSILALLIISGLLIYSFKVKNTNLRQKNIILRKDQKVATLEKEKLRQEIEAKNRELASKALHLVNKNEMLNSITGILDQMNVTQETQNADLVRNAKRTIIRNINLDEQWEDFKIHFEEVHANFFRQLVEDYPSLSQTDLRLCAYLLINLDNKEIAQISNISPDSVRKRKQRLREKLNITKNQDIQIFLNQYERA
jgi:tetratricopeptide (TPR) repeat protein